VSTRPIERVRAALEAAGCRRSGASGWTCPAHQDGKPSLSVREGHNGGVVVKCHAGCEVEQVARALGLTMRDLAPTRDREASEDWTPRGPAVAAYPYQDEDGRVLYTVCRTVDKQFPAWRPDPASKTGKRWKLTDASGRWLVRRLLYRLPRVLEAACADETVYVVEGEKDVHAMEAAGVVATTNLGGAAGAWLDSYSQALAGAAVVVVADLDGPDPKSPRNSYRGQRRARHVARKLARHTDNLRLVMPAAGKDAADHLAAGYGPGDFLPLPDRDDDSGDDAADTGQAPAATSAAQGQEGAQEAPDGAMAAPGGGKPESTATELVSIAAARYELGTSTMGEPFAVARPGHGPYLARMLRGGQASLRAELAAVYADTHQRAPSSSALADAMQVLEGRAIRAEPAALALRVARHGDGLVLDLGDPTGRVVSLTPQGWEVAERSPVLFRRTKLTSPLPEPERGGDLAELRGLVNLSAASWPLALAWLVASLMPELPHPIPLLTGEQGAGKSTTARILTRLVDPSPAQLRTAPKDLEQWAVAAAGSWMVVLDNLSGLAPWLSDALCRAVTGDGMVRRALYENNDLAVLAFRRVVVLTAIDAGALRGDLADRLVLFDLDRPTKRRTDADLEAAFLAAWPRLVGALLDLACDTLAVLPGIRLEDPPRMADFAAVVAAVDRLLQTDALATYRELSARLAYDIGDQDPVIRAITRLLAETPTWQGSAEQLLGKLTAALPEGARLPKDWPTTPRGMAGALVRAAPTLRTLGYGVEKLERDRSGRRGRGWWLAANGTQAPPTDPTLLGGIVEQGDGAGA
jgi:hypothetical protein